MRVTQVKELDGMGFEVTWVNGRGRRQTSLVSSADRLVEEFGAYEDFGKCYETPSKTAGQRGRNRDEKPKSRVPGRPRKFRNAAEKQRAYRERKRLARGTDPQDENR